MEKKKEREKEEGKRSRQRSSLDWYLTAMQSWHLRHHEERATGSVASRELYRFVEILPSFLYPTVQNMSPLTVNAEGTTTFVVWTAAEIFVTLICTGIPVLWPLVHHWSPRFLSYSKSISKGNRDKEREGPVFGESSILSPTVLLSSRRPPYLMRVPPDLSRHRTALTRDLSSVAYYRRFCHVTTGDA